MNTEGRMWGNELNPGGLSGAKTHTRRRKVLIFIIVLIIAIVAELLRSNLIYIEVEQFTYLANDVPKGFDGVKIVQISDYHNHGGGYEDRLLSKVEAQKPDYIFLTGDIADSIRTNIDKANSFLEKVSKIADCYLVWGNHDYDISEDDREKMKECCKKNGITVLENEYTYLERGGSKLLLVGTDDSPEFGYAERLMNDLPTGEKFVIWLHHYPEDFKVIVEGSKSGSKVDLLFAGHAHGGLIRLPFLKGLYAPGQGFMPEYTGGRYDEDGSTMIVSRGVGNSGWTLRFGDPFHLVVCTLKSGKK